MAGTSAGGVVGASADGILFVNDGMSGGGESVVALVDMVVDTLRVKENGMP
jgi:hypothetical protein